MKVNQRFFQLDQEWCIIHLPERPNGFGIFIIGDINHYADSKTSSWIQNIGRFEWLEYLRNLGYTLFYSNLYGRNWGSPEAVRLSKRLYHIVMKREILNSKIHILAEGMGALTALELLETMEDKIRSAAFVNPCLDLKAHLNHEKEHKFFYKRLLKEVAAAYGVSPDEAEKEIMARKRLSFYKSQVPVKIWQATDNEVYSSKAHSRPYEEHRKKSGLPIELSLHLSEKKMEALKSISSFYEKNEQIL